MWRLRVVHTTGYAYQSPVTASYNEARLTPRSNNRQNVILNRVETIPATRSYRYIDYWGTAVTAFDLHAPHTDLTVMSSSVVETERAEGPATEAGWDDLRSDAVIDRFDDLLRPTGHAPASKRVASVGRRSAKPTRRPKPLSPRPIGCATNWTICREQPACTRRGWTRSRRARVSARTSYT